MREFAHLGTQCDIRGRYAPDLGTGKLESESSGSRLSSCAGHEVLSWDIDSDLNGLELFTCCVEFIYCSFWGDCEVEVKKVGRAGEGR